MNSAIEEHTANYGVLRIGRYTVDQSPAVYDLTHAVNFNMAVLGESGSGKTHSIREILRFLHAHGTTNIIIDVHGDYQRLDGLPDGGLVDIHFAYANGTGTINPLRIDNADAGGLFRSVESFLRVVRLFNPNLGSRQASTLKSLVWELLEEYGFQGSDPSLWPSESPTVFDLRDFMREVVQSGELKMTPSVLKEARKAVADAGNIDAITSEDERTAAFAGIGSAVVRALDALENSGGSRNIKRIEDVLDTISDMCDSGLFGPDTLKIRPRAVNRLVLTGLNESHQLVMMHLIFDRLLNVALRQYPKDEPNLPRMMVTADEGKLLKAISNDSLSPLNRAVTEGRGFGLGVIMGVQSADHLTADTRRNCGLTLLLPVHNTDISSAARIFRVSDKDLGTLKPRSEGIVIAKNRSPKAAQLWRT